MSDPNGIIAKNPIPINDDNSEVDKTIILKEKFNDDFIKNRSSGSFAIILPDEVKVKEQEGNPKKKLK